MSGSKAGAARARGGKGRGNAGAAPAPAARGGAASRAGGAASRAGEAPSPAREVAPEAREGADAGPREGEYVVTLPTFEGPLDLLLHLIQQHELDILDIPVSFVTEKYLEYLKVMRSLSIDLASEYLVMAATLAHIKSKMLLPSVPAGQDDDGMPGEEEDPRAELVRRLLEYQKYKVAAAELAERGTLGRDVFTRGMSESEVPKGPAPFASSTIFGLLDAFERVLKRTNVQIDHEVVFDRISITDRIVELTEKLSARRAMRFEDLLLDSVSKGGVIPRFEVVITFLAVLEMCKLRLIRVHQTDPLAPIHIQLSVADGAPSPGFEPEDGAPAAEWIETAGSDAAGAPPAGEGEAAEVGGGEPARAEDAEAAELETVELSVAEAAELEFLEAAAEESVEPAEPEHAGPAEEPSEEPAALDVLESPAEESVEPVGAELVGPAEEPSEEPAALDVLESPAEESVEPAGAELVGPAEELSEEPAALEVVEVAAEESVEPAEPELVGPAEELSEEPAALEVMEAAAEESVEPAEPELAGPAEELSEEPAALEVVEAAAEESVEPADPEVVGPAEEPSDEPAPPERAEPVEETSNTRDVADVEPAVEADASAAPDETRRDALAHASDLPASDDVAAPPTGVDEVDAGSGRDGG
ncbi:segregation/condensation protein A [Sorangium sp. So ce136]|uniref:segregation and condensation protein A n=1 Tax=Sorangium sp. So ce136 TaxID=3133284 RepID=UPI003F01D95B